jgi:hypothetical protein
MTFAVRRTRRLGGEKGNLRALRLSGCISPIPCGLGWRMGRHDRDRVAIRKPGCGASTTLVIELDNNSQESVFLFTKPSGKSAYFLCPAAQR